MQKNRFVMLKSYPSFLSKEESTAIKGLLILLIVLAHNSIVTGATGLFPYLYAFHVYCFYILPFIYGFSYSKANVNQFQYLFLRQWHNWKKLGIIYLFWCFIGIACNIVFKHASLQVFPILRAVLWGNQIFLAENCSFAYLWFLPTILAVMFWRDVFFMCNLLGKITIFLTGVLLWTATVIGLGSFHTIGFWCPLALVQGLYFSMGGIAVRFLLEHLRDGNGRISRYYVLLFPLVPLYVYFRGYLPYGCVYLTWSCCPIIAFISLYAMKNWLCRVKLFQLAGKYSLQIYLLHTVIFNILAYVVPSRNLAVGIVIYLLTLLLCGAGIYCIEKTKIFRWMIFPLKQSTSKL